MFKPPITSRRVRIARLVAVAVDAIQIVVFPVFSEGFILPFDIILDLAAAIIMVALLGWHIAFIPTFIIEGLPFADLAPSWTIAVLIVTRATSLNPRAGVVAKQLDLGAKQHER